MDWFLYDNGLRHERVKLLSLFTEMQSSTDLALMSTQSMY